MARGRYAEAPPPALEADVGYLCVLTTDAGEIRIRLRPDLAPRAVNALVFLVHEGFYDGLGFHRVVPGFIAQTGDPSGRGSGGPGYRLPDELSEHPFGIGTVGMANPAPGQNGSQFFVTLADARHLDRRFTVVGEVVAGLPVLQALPARVGDDPDDPAPLRIERARIETDAAVTGA